MRSIESWESQNMENTSRRASLSIVIDDFDSKSANDRQVRPNAELGSCPAGPKAYTRKNSDASIKKILEEAEHRKHEFWKLIDEHNAVIENLKRMEKLENGAVCKVSQPTITT